MSLLCTYDPMCLISGAAAFNLIIYAAAIYFFNETDFLNSRVAPLPTGQ